MSQPCEQMRRQLLDNYLRNQQQQTQQQPQQPTQQYHPSLFSNFHQQTPVYDGDRSDTLSDISRMSSQYSRQTANMRNQPTSVNNMVQISTHTQQIPTNTEETSAIVVSELPDNITIEDFTNLAKKWIEMDNWLKKYQEMAKQKRKQKDKLTQVITHYMTKYNIEDLNTTEGKICCKVRQVKSGMNQKVVKQKITEIFKDNEETCNAIITKIFEDREKVEKVSLRRIKISNINDG
jgi:hypothetical protein